MSGKGPTAACPDRVPDLEAYLLGSLEGSRRSRMEDHLDACPACRHALAEARIGLEALRALAEAPVPFLCNEVPDVEERHRDVPAGRALPAAAPGDRRDGTSSASGEVQPRRGLPATGLENRRDGGHRGTDATPRPAWSAWVAAAAVLLVGVAVGRWTLPGGDEPAARSDPPRDAWIQPAQIEALARAEVLLDLGVPWLENLQAVLTGVIDATEAGAPEPALRELRRQARRLVLDGRKLRAALDAERDAELLATVIHAEVFLEEVAAFEPGRAPDFFTPSELSDLRVGFAAADARGAADRALLASGWIASESGL